VRRNRKDLREEMTEQVEERRRAVRRGVEGVTFIMGRLTVPIPTSTREEVTDVIASRLGIGESEVSVTDLEEIIGDQVGEFLSSERLLRYIDRDLAGGKYNYLFPKGRHER